MARTRADIIAYLLRAGAEGVVKLDFGAEGLCGIVGFQVVDSSAFMNSFLGQLKIKTLQRRFKADLRFEPHTMDLTCKRAAKWEAARHGLYCFKHMSE